MRALHLRTAAIALVAGIGLSGCATYSPFGYGSGVSIGYGGYYDPFYDPYYRGYRTGYYGSRYGGYYGSPYGGWYNGFYYPGFGYYVYDRNNRRQMWNDVLKDYWASRAATLQTSGVSNPAVTSSGTVRPSRAMRERPARTRIATVDRTRPATAERVRTTREERTSAASTRRTERASARASRRAARTDD